MKVAIILGCSFALSASAVWAQSDPISSTTTATMKAHMDCVERRAVEYSAGVDPASEIAKAAATSCRITADLLRSSLADDAHAYAPVRTPLRRPSR
jgi:hypothetical protein